MDKRVLYVTLGLCLGIASSTAGQSPVSKINHAASARFSGITPAMQALWDRENQLDHAAATALDAGQYAVAEVDARQVLSVAGYGDGEADEIFAESLDAQGLTQEALAAYQNPVLSQSDFPRDLLPYALLLLKAGDWPDALAAYEKALPFVSQQNSSVYPHLSQAFTFSPDDPQPTQLAAAIHAALGLTYDWECDWAGNPQTDKALAEYQQALQIAPGWDMANYYYADFLQRHGRTTQAQAAFIKTLKIGHGGVRVAARKALARMKKPA